MKLADCAVFRAQECLSYMATVALGDRASLGKTKEWRNVTLETLRGEIIPRDKPAVLKGWLSTGPIVRASAQSPAALLEYIRARDLGRPIRILIGKPEIKGCTSFATTVGLELPVRTQALSRDPRGHSALRG